MSVSHIFPVRPLLVPANVQLLLTPLSVSLASCPPSSLVGPVSSEEVRRHTEKPALVLTGASTVPDASRSLSTSHEHIYQWIITEPPGPACVHCQRTGTVLDYPVRTALD